MRNLIDSQNVGKPRTEADLNALLQYGIPTFFNPLLNRQTSFTETSAASTHKASKSTANG